tara:strand:+ start:4999 stop:5154 length:156 start_codon:yes stop_codon:yes gene_type:complete
MQEPENPVFYITKKIKSLDVKKRNGIVALAIINLLVIVLLRSFLSSTGLLS